ncbi:MAG: hypothetical protein ACOVLC_04230 [Flavobacterium sp.]|jgi:hypothetical protein
MDITNPKQRVKNGLSFMIGGFLISLLLDYFWSNLHWQESLFRKESLIRLVVFFVVGFFMKTKKEAEKQ